MGVIYPSVDRSIMLTSKADQIDGHGSKMEVYWCQLFAASTEILPHDACMTSISIECKPKTLSLLSANQKKRTMAAHASLMSHHFMVKRSL